MRKIQKKAEILQLWLGCYHECCILRPVRWYQKLPVPNPRHTRWFWLVPSLFDEFLNVRHAVFFNIAHGFSVHYDSRNSDTINRIIGIPGVSSVDVRHGSQRFSDGWKPETNVKTQGLSRLGSLLINILPCKWRFFKNTHRTSLEYFIINSDEFFIKNFQVIRYLRDTTEEPVKFGLPPEHQRGNARAWWVCIRHVFWLY